jgi:hypothetical protein
MAMPTVADDDLAYWSDDDDLVDSAEKARLRELEQKAIEDQQRLLQHQQQQLQHQQQHLQYQQQQYEQQMGFAAVTAVSSTLSSSSLSSGSGDIGEGLDDFDIGNSRHGNEFTSGPGRDDESVNLDDLALSQAAATEVRTGEIGGTDRQDTGEDGEEHDDDDDNDDALDLDNDLDLEADLPSHPPAVPQAPSSAPPPASITRMGGTATTQWDSPLALTHNQGANKPSDAPSQPSDDPEGEP